MKYTVLLLALSAAVSAQTFPAKLVKPFWPDRQGTMEINDQGITFTSPHVKHGPESPASKRGGGPQGHGLLQKFPAVDLHGVLCVLAWWFSCVILPVPGGN